MLNNNDELAVELTDRLLQPATRVVGGAARIPDHTQILGADEWGTAIAETITRFDLSADTGSDFHGRMRVHMADGMALCELSAERHVATHNPSRSRQPGGPLHLLSLQLSGEANMELGDQHVLLKPGDIGFYSADQQGVVASGDGYRSLCLTLPANAIDIPTDQLREVQARPVGPDRGLSPALAALLTSLNDCLDRLTPAQQARALRSAVDLAVTLVLHEAGETPVQIDPVTRLRQQVYAYIEDHLHDPELDVSQLAAAHYVSVRHVHNIFRGTEQTAAERIRSRRLEKARRELVDPGMIDVPVAAVAGRCGFANPSHFGNLFKERFGITPAAYRMQAHREL